jgi:tetratricopeptide (TPR) repeat protein
MNAYHCKYRTSKEQFESNEGDMQYLANAAIYAYAALNGKSVGKSWSYFASKIGVAAEELRHHRVPLSDSQIADFAIVAVREALLGREWTERWLTATNYGNTPSERISLLASMFAKEDASLSPRPLTNVPRRISMEPLDLRLQSALQVILKGLQHQVSVVALVGKNGMGKTRVLYEVSNYFLGQPSFQIIVFIEDLGRSTKDPFNTVLDAVLSTSGNLDATGLDTDRKCSEVINIMASKPTLIIIDSIDAVADSRLYEWVQHIPHPSKILVSARRALPLHESFTECRLNPLNPEDWPYTYRPFLEEMRRDYPEMSGGEIEQVIRDVDGNPLAMRMMLAYMRTRRGEVATSNWQGIKLSLEDAVRLSCDVLTENGRKVLYALMPFPEQTNLEPLRSVAGMDRPTFRAAIDELLNLRLVEWQASDSLYWNGVVREVAKDLISKEKHLQEAIYRRWIEAYCSIVESVGYCPNDHAKLRTLDPEMKVLPLVISYVDSHSGFERQALRLAECTYYYYVRGYWSTMQSPHMVAVRAAQKLGDVNAQIYHLSYEVEWLTKRGNFTEIKNHQYLERLANLNTASNIAPVSRIVYLNTLAYYLIEGTQAYEKAERLLKQSIELAKSIHSPKVLIATYRLGYCYCKKPDTMDTAREFLTGAIQLAEQYGDHRTATSTRLLLAKLLLGGGNQFAIDPIKYLEAGKLLEYAEQSVFEVGDKTQQARFHEVQGLYYLASGQYGSALHVLIEAAQLYRQLARPNAVAEIEKLTYRCNAQNV